MTDEQKAVAWPVHCLLKHEELKFLVGIGGTTQSWWADIGDFLAWCAETKRPITPVSLSLWKRFREMDL